ncbi:MAG: antitoxin VbhA family protein [Selenomonadaceae bacterium]|nr:antitoxin VbhA family protein [Selenomonadaceae bacterium]
MGDRLQNMYSAIKSQELEGLSISPYGKRILMMFATNKISLAEAKHMLLAPDSLSK